TPPTSTVVTTVTRVPSFILLAVYPPAAPRPAWYRIAPDGGEARRHSRAAPGKGSPPMPMTPDDIRARIRAALPDADVAVTDTTGGGDHFSATVVSSQFAGKGPVDRHRLVY